MRCKVQVGDVQLAYEEVGSGSKVVLLLAGAIGSSRTDFSEQLKAWKGSKKLKIIALDGRGYGESRPPNRCFDVDFYRTDAEDALLFMKKLGQTKYSVVGWSDGANVAAIMAARQPGVIEKIVMCGGNAFMTSEDVQIMKNIRDISTWGDEALEPMFAEYGKDYFAATWHDWVDHWVELLGTGGTIDLYRKDLPLITCETLVIHGENDDLVPMTHAQFICDNIKNSRLLIWKEGGHDFHIKFASNFNLEMQNFIFS